MKGFGKKLKDHLLLTVASSLVLGGVAYGLNWVIKESQK